MHTTDMTWEQWASVIDAKGKEAIELCNEMLSAYKKWYSRTYGKTNTQLATEFAKTETDILRMQYCYSAFKEFNDSMNNVAVSARDRKADLIEFVDVR